MKTEIDHEIVRLWQKLHREIEDYVLRKVNHPPLIIAPQRRNTSNLV